MRDIKSDFWGYFLAISLTVTYIVGLIFYLWFYDYGMNLWVKVSDGMLLTNYALGSSLRVLVVFAILGLYFGSIILIEIIQRLFWPRSDKEIRRAKELAKLRHTASESTFLLRRRELKKLHQLEDIREEIKERLKKNG